MPLKDYIGSTKEELEHLIGNWLIFVVWMHSGDYPYDTQKIAKRKTRFIQGIEKSLSLPVYGGVTYDALRGILRLARTDWEVKSNVDALYEECNRVGGE